MIPNGHGTVQIQETKFQFLAFFLKIILSSKETWYVKCIEHGKFLTLNINPNNFIINKCIN